MKYRNRQDKIDLPETNLFSQNANILCNNTPIMRTLTLDILKIQKELELEIKEECSLSIDCFARYLY